MLGKLVLTGCRKFSIRVTCSRQNHSCNYPLIRLTGVIKSDLDEGNIGVGIYVDLKHTIENIRKFSL